jgi:hypothetical protein
MNFSGFYQREIVACFKGTYNGVEYPFVVVKRYRDDYVTYHAPSGTVMLSDCFIDGAIDRTLDMISHCEYMIKSNREYHIPDLAPADGRRILDWKYRENRRFETGEYKELPNLEMEFNADHFIHRSTQKDEEDFIAFTPSEAYGLADRQVRMRLGRYLKKFHPLMADATVARLTEKFKAELARESAPYELHFTGDKDIINDIFETKMYACGSGYESCMYGKFNRQTHRPYHVYADSPDVCVAYLTKMRDIVARTVVNCKKQEWIRTYSIESRASTTCRVLEEMLESKGYSSGDLLGCRLTKLPTCEPCLPYIDNSGMDVDDAGDYWVVVRDGEYTCDQTDGTATCNAPRCSECNRLEDDCECVYCECCDVRRYGGCDHCSTCEECDQCIEHGGCDCARCEDCNELVTASSRWTTTCSCERCDECSELTSNCDCPEPEEENEEEETNEPIPANAA